MIKEIWTIIEHQDGKLRKATTQVLSTAKQLSDKLEAKTSAILLGSNIKELINEIAIYGVDKVYLADNEKLTNYTAEAYTNIIAPLLKEHQPEIVLCGASSMGKDLMPKLAARLACGLAVDCTKVDIDEGKLIALRPVYAGKALVEVKWNENQIQMLSLRPNVFTAKQLEDYTNAEIIEISSDPGDLRTKIKEIVRSAAGKIELTEADIIVSGGRGMGSEDYTIIEELAKVLGAAVGASRASVDAGWRPHSDQVGQTGKTVSPQLYIACGISGAIQHLAGMSSSKVIVAINKDEDAPIFKIADYGIVADLFVAVPILTEELKKVLSE